jgi:hypothetical protein
VAQSERERWVKDPNKGRLLILLATRPRLSAAEKNKIADEVAKWATAWFGKPVSRTCVFECWKKHSRIFNDRAGEDV